MPELHGEDCPRCGFRTLEAEFDGETWLRCVTDSCPRGWYTPSEPEESGKQTTPHRGKLNP